MESLSDAIHEMCENLVGLRRRQLLGVWERGAHVLECWQNGVPSGFALGLEFERVFWLAWAVGIEVHLWAILSLLALSLSARPFHCFHYATRDGTTLSIRLSHTLVCTQFKLQIPKETVLQYDKCIYTAVQEGPNINIYTRIYIYIYIYEYTVYYCKSVISECTTNSKLISCRLTSRCGYC